MEDRIHPHFDCLLMSILCLLMLSAQPALAGTAEDLAELAETYSIGVVHKNATFPVETSYGRISGNAPSAEQVDAYGPMLIDEFSRYPKEFIEKSGLRQIVLCTELTFGGQSRNAIPDLQNSTLYLDIAQADATPAYRKSVIHHEFFHIVDYRDDGKLQEDPDWANLNPKSFRYQRARKRLQFDSKEPLFVEAGNGILTKFAKTALEEDKAELFAHMIVHPKKVAKRADDDKVLAAKLKLMEKQLQSFCEEMNAEFWKTVRAGQK